ncbi:hypothetical protein H2198_008423 [Neophaeococcomyces mojaviensis]|uniref:Uncharacterized protein n=1 Tax=Neophaeococcomyces mojaviensis TaxID=3383035 RepID=A0ACC2ZXI9_9EURO|nr:hypothetical protein H2198_008423 [Knufia sp. JES_112]
MRFANYAVALATVFFRPVYSAAVNHDTVSLSEQLIQAIFIAPQVFESNDAPPKATREHIKQTKDLLDTGRLCDNITYVTLKAPQGHVSFYTGYVTATEENAPTVWNLTRDNKEQSYQIQAADPADRRLYFGGGSGRLSLTTSDYYRYYVKLSSAGPPSLVIYSSSGCLSFEKDGFANIRSDTACTALQFTKVKPPAYESAIMNADMCADNVFKKFTKQIVKDVEEDVNNATQHIAGVDYSLGVETETKIAAALEDARTWVVDKARSVGNAISSVFS